MILFRCYYLVSILFGVEQEGTMVLNGSGRDESKITPIKIKIGNTIITQEKSAKLLGIQFNDRQTWTNQIKGTQGVVSGLNKRLFAIKRLKNSSGVKMTLKVRKPPKETTVSKVCRAHGLLLVKC